MPEGLLNLKANFGTPNLCTAAYLSNIDAVRFWIKFAPNEINTPIKIEKDSEDDITPIEDLNWTPLHWATFRGHFHICKILLDNGADIEKPDECKRTPLHWACCRGHLDVVRLLCDYGANYECLEEDQWTPLHWATYQGHLKVIYYLIDIKHANYEAEDSTNETPLFHAANLREIENGPEILSYLITTKKVKVNVKNKYNWTPLHYAALNGLLKNVHVLIDYGSADVSIKNDLDETPRDLAFRNGHSTIVNYIDFIISRDKTNKNTQSHY